MLSADVPKGLKREMLHAMAASKRMRGHADKFDRNPQQDRGFPDIKNVLGVPVKAVKGIHFRLDKFVTFPKEKGPVVKKPSHIMFKGV